VSPSFAVSVRDSQTDGALCGNPEVAIRR
jgi:hypothetical protein